MSTVELVEAFKQRFNINADLSDVECRKISTEPYQSLEKDHRFGEKNCLLYDTDFKIFNVDVSIKILSFLYESHAEVLKLEIHIMQEFLAQEMQPCRSFLQRKRNLNTTFEILVKFIKLWEMRRIISTTVLNKFASISTRYENGLIIQCCAPNTQTHYMDCTWRIAWNIHEYEVTDCIECLLNDLAIPATTITKVKKKLKNIVCTDSDFHSKLKLWKGVLKDLYGQYNPLTTIVQREQILEISDSESDESVIEVNNSVTDEIFIVE